jgi:hypothetical protein
LISQKRPPPPANKNIINEPEIELRSATSASVGGVGVGGGGEDLDEGDVLHHVGLQDGGRDELKDKKRCSQPILTICRKIIYVTCKNLVLFNSQILLFSTSNGKFIYSIS